MKKNLVRSALLSARLFADARSHPQLRPGCPGVMDIDRALQTLLDDGAAPEDERHSSWLTRGRIALALQQALNPELQPGSAHELAEPGHPGTQHTVSFLLEQATKNDAAKLPAERAAEWDRLAYPILAVARAATDHAPAALRGQLDFVASSAADAERSSRPIDWQTEVAIAPNGATKVTSSVEVTGAKFAALARLCDPSRWAEDSMFWFESSRLDDGRPVPPDELLDGAPPRPWTGQLLERVASTVAVFTALLDIDFQVAEDTCLVTYRLARPMNGLRLDDGYAYVRKVGDDRYRTQLVKWVDFDDAPFGGPSVLDQLLPSYLGSWLRVQQDIWAAKAFPTG